MGYEVFRLSANINLRVDAAEYGIFVTNQQIDKLLKELKYIHFDVLALNKSRRPREVGTKWKDFANFPWIGDEALLSPYAQRQQEILCS